MSQALAQLSVIEAHLELVRVQIQELRKSLAPQATRPLPERCAGVPGERCAVQDGEWASAGSFADPHRVQCRACGEERAG